MSNAALPEAPEGGGKQESDRFYCPYPGCKRSFAELWRLKVHYRAPPDIRGSGKERGHGTELTHCPKCGKALKPGKHHVGCSAGKTAPRQASKRSRVESLDGDLDVLLDGPGLGQAAEAHVFGGMELMNGSISFGNGGVPGLPTVGNRNGFVNQAYNQGQQGFQTFGQGPMDGNSTLYGDLQQHQQQQLQQQQSLLHHHHQQQNMLQQQQQQQQPMPQFGNFVNSSSNSMGNMMPPSLNQMQQPQAVPSHLDLSCNNNGNSSNQQQNMFMQQLQQQQQQAQQQQQQQQGFAQPLGPYSGPVQMQQQLPVNSLQPQQQQQQMQLGIMKGQQQQPGMSTAYPMMPQQQPQQQQQGGLGYLGAPGRMGFSEMMGNQPPQPPQFQAPQPPPQQQQPSALQMLPTLGSSVSAPGNMPLPVPHFMQEQPQHQGQPQQQQQLHGQQVGFMNMMDPTATAAAGSSVQPVGGSGMGMPGMMNDSSPNQLLQSGEVDSGSSFATMFDDYNLIDRIPSPPPLPTDFNTGATSNTGMLFNFSQFNQKLPAQGPVSTSMMMPPDMEPSLQQTVADLWSPDMTFDHHTDGDLMQLLFGAPDQPPNMATIHLHHFLDDLDPSSPLADLDNGLRVKMPPSPPPPPPPPPPRQPSVPLAAAPGVGTIASSAAVAAVSAAAGMAGLGVPDSTTAAAAAVVAAAAAAAAAGQIAAAHSGPMIKQEIDAPVVKITASASGAGVVPTCEAQMQQQDGFLRGLNGDNGMSGAVGVKKEVDGQAPLAVGYLNGCNTEAKNGLRHGLQQVERAVGVIGEQKDAA